MIIQAAKELNLMPTTEGGLDYKLELTHAPGYSGIEHSLPIIGIQDDIVELFKASPDHQLTDIVGVPRRSVR
ncbi:MAG: hypothetical protein WEE89_04435 [Gemmatimonadota bacterium]